VFICLFVCLFVCLFPLGAGAAAPTTGDAAVGVADVGDGGGDATENFLPLDDNNMELDQEPEEHVDRQQVSVLVLTGSESGSQ